MKKLCIFLCVLLSICIFTSCSQNESALDTVSAKDIVDSVLEVTAHPECDKLYLKSENNMDTYSMSLWADSLFDECADYDILTDYAIYVSAGTTTYEIAVLRCEDKSDISVLNNLIERRKETLEMGDKGMYDKNFDKRISDSKIISDGTTVIFLLTDDNTAATDAIDKLKKQ